MFLVGPVQAPGGRLIDARTRTPLANAEVTIVGLRGSTRTDAAGRFVWPAAAAPPFLVVVVLSDGRVTRPLSVASLEPATGTDLVLTVESQSETITVQGAAPAIDVTAAAASVLISGLDIELRRPATLAQTLEHVAGVSAISEGQSSTPAIRGLARGRTLLIVDGARVSTERGAGASASFLDPGVAASVTVARGPGSVAYGSDAFGGVVAVRMRRPDDRTPLGVRLALTAGGAGAERRADLEVSHGYGHGGLLFGVRWRDFDDYSSPEGMVPQSSWRDGGARLRWQHGRDDTRWSISMQSDLARDVERPRSDSNAILASSPREDAHRLTFSLVQAAAGGFRDVKVEAFAGTSRERVHQDRLAAPGRPRRLDRADTTAHDAQVRVAGEREIAGVRLQTGAEMHGRFGLETTDTAFTYNAAGTLSSTAVTRSIESAHRTDIGVFAQGELAVSRRTRLHGGLRGDVVRSVNRGGFFGHRTITSRAIAGLAAITIRPVADLAVSGQVSRGFRDPTLSDRFARGPVGRGVVEGNPELESEHSLQFDATTRYTIRRLTIGAATYRYAIRDLVERYSDSPELFRLRNRGKARLTGVELEVSVSAPRGWIVELTAEAARGRDALDGTPLDDVPPRRVSAAARHASERWAAYVRVSSVGGDEAAGPSEVPTPGYSLVDAGAAWRITSHVHLHGVVRNALDSRYYSSAGPRWVWAPGRSLSVTGVLSR